MFEALFLLAWIVTGAVVEAYAAVCDAIEAVLEWLGLLPPAGGD